MVDLPLNYLKLVHSVLRIIPRVCAVNGILNPFKHLIVVGRHVLLSHGTQPIHSTSRVSVRHIGSLICWLHIVRLSSSTSSSSNTLKLIYACIVFRMRAVCVRGTRYNARVFLGQDVCWALWRLINLHLVEFLLILRSEEELLKIMIDIRLISGGWHRLWILEGMKKRLLWLIAHHLMYIMCVYAAVKA